MSLEIKASKPYVWLKDEDTNKIIQVKNDAGDLKTVDELGNEVTINGVQITAHASRHDRGGADALDWANLSKYKKVLGAGGAVGASGSPATFTVLTLDANYYNLLPLEVRVSPTGLGTGESLTITVVLKDENGNTYTVFSQSGVTAQITVKLSDMGMLTFLGTSNVGRVVEVDVTAESSATSTSASVSIDAIALEM